MCVGSTGNAGGIEATHEPVGARVAIAPGSSHHRTDRARPKCLSWVDSQMSSHKPSQVEHTKNENLTPGVRANSLSRLYSRSNSLRTSPFPTNCQKIR